MNDSSSGDKKFLGTGWSFPPSFERRAHVQVGTNIGARTGTTIGTNIGFSGAMDASHGIGASLVSAEPDIEQSLRILLSTNPGERVMQPAYGCGIKRKVFEQLNESELTEIRHLVEKAILFFEPRITVNEVALDAGRWIDGELRIHIDYTVRSTNSRSNMVYPMYFREGTALQTVTTFAAAVTND